jgi:biopolymer transport protein ExbD
MRIPNVARSSALSINMTPMIDVTFLLIIFFLVSSHLGKQENNAKLDLPLSETGLEPKDADQRPASTVQILVDGTIHLGSHSISVEELQAALSIRHRETPGGLRVRIRTDRNVPYSIVARILKICATVGITDVVFSVYEAEG